MSGELEMDELRADLITQAAKSIRQIMVLSVAPEEIARQVVADLTRGWTAEKHDTLFRDARGYVRDGRRLTGPDPGDPAEHVPMVRYTVTTAAREFNAEELAALERRRSVASWEFGDHSTPPPPGTSLGTLLRQDRWWMTRDDKAMTLEEMHPAHRANLLAFLERNAMAYRDAINQRHMFNAPDGVAEEFERDLYAPEEERRRAARKWLRKKPLVKRLRRMVKADKRAFAANA